MLARCQVRLERHHVRRMTTRAPWYRHLAGPVASVTGTRLPEVTQRRVVAARRRREEREPSLK